VNELAGDPQPGGWHSLGTESLYHASEFSDTTCLRLLLEAGPHPLRISYCFARALDFDNAAAALLYLEHGADPNFRVPWMDNRTHLQRAVMNGRATEVVEAMITRGGDVNATDNRGFTSFRYAVRFGHPALAELFLKHGASSAGVTDVDHALGDCVTGATVRLPDLGGEGVDVLCRMAQLGDAGAVTRLLDAGVPADAAGGLDGSPALHWACWRGHLEAARVFVERGASLTRVNQYGGTALGSTVHGSFNCHDVEGGPSMRLDEEVTHGDYPGLVEMLIGAGAPLPERIRGGSPGVRAALRRHGVPEPRA
jgi:ankyrin repeat protein